MNTKKNKSILKSTRNTRAILPGSLRYVRSDVPDRLTQDEIAWLIENNITTAVDLREEDERRRRPCLLEDNAAFRYVCMPVTGGNAIPPSPDKVSASYLAMNDSRMNEIITAIISADTNVLYFCNAGKDRTGVVSALLLRRLGMPDEYIVRDYMASAENLRDMLEAYAKSNPDTDIDIITPHEEYIKGFLERID